MSETKTKERLEWEESAIRQGIENMETKEDKLSVIRMYMFDLSFSREIIAKLASLVEKGRI